MNRKNIEDILNLNSEEMIRSLQENKKQVFQVIPELEDEYGFEQRNPWHLYDVWKHTLVALKNSKPDLEIRLALLLHDIGKPHSYQDDENVRHFRKHPEKGAQIAKNILERLGYNEDEVRNICFLIENHANTIEMQDVNMNNIEIMKKLLHIQYCDASAYNPKYIKPVFEKLDIIKENMKLKEEELKQEQRDIE